MTTPVVEEEYTPSKRYAVRRNGLYLATHPAMQGMTFSSPTIGDAAKFGAPDDIENLLKHLFDLPPASKATRFDPAQGKQVQDDSVPPHFGLFHASTKDDYEENGVKVKGHGVDRDGIEIVSTHT